MKGKLMKTDMKNAFTLSEVLITLGIIGVVAALTLPSLIKNYQHKVLKTKFAKSYSILSQTTEEVKMEYGDCSAVNTEVIKASIYDKLNKVQGKKLAKAEQWIFHNYKQHSLMGVELDSVLHVNCLMKNANWVNTWGEVYQAIIIDGSYVGLCSQGTERELADEAYKSWRGTYIVVDTNGNKRPNRFGEDIFAFHVNGNNCKLEEASTPRTIKPDEDGYGGEIPFDEVKKCSLTDKKSDANGFFCAAYAIKDKCPDGSNRSYWECIP